MALPTLASTKRANLHLEGVCVRCSRKIRVEMDPLIEKFGPNAILRDIARRITCAGCGKRIATSVYPEKTGP